jgi:hypothetical protein
MPEPRSPADDPPPEHEESPLARAEEIYEEVGAENPDPITRREAIEGELEEEGLSDEGSELGEHIE